MFEFEGNIDSSKSLVNRALILQSYEPQIQLDFQSQSMDVRVLQNALADFRKGGQEFHCSEAGTAFRFLVLRLSREPGTWMVTGTERLLSRPQQELKDVLKQVGVSVEVGAQKWILHSSGWQTLSEITVDTGRSSQFTSALLLNGWDLPQELRIRCHGESVSEMYSAMTFHLVRKFGLDVQRVKDGYLIPAKQKPLCLHHQIEADISSCFALASCAVQNGKARIQNFPAESFQPDMLFLNLFRDMGVLFSQDNQGLSVQRTTHIAPVNCNLKNTPDLFPVLAVLCARAKGVSSLAGLSQLAHKESDRLFNTLQLLKRLGRKTNVTKDEVRIYGEESPFTGHGDFDPDQDHRMAMAAHVANLYGAHLQILHPEVVEKSFPQFWQATGANA